MRLRYQFCKCNDKKIKVKRTCKKINLILLTFLFSLTLFGDIYTTFSLAAVDSSASRIICEHTSDYKRSHESCKSLTKQIDCSTETIHAHDASTTVFQYASKLNEELKTLLKQENQTFQVLRKEQKLCILDYIKDDKFPPGFMFYFKLFWLNFVIFLLSVCHLCRGRVSLFPRTDDGSLFAFYRVLISVFPIISKPLCVIAVLNMTHHYMSSSSKSQIADEFLLNC